MNWKMTTIVLALITMHFAGLDAFAQNGSSKSPDPLDWNSPLVVAQCVWMLLVTVGAAVYAYVAGRKNSSANAGKELRGLNLPQGSIRAILALAVIGSFVNVIGLGSPALGENFDSALTAFGTLTGSIVGFYFGTRGATSQPTS